MGSLTQELERLDELRQRGVLDEAEFRQAKARLLAESDGAHPSPPEAALNEISQTVGRLRRSRSDRWIGGVCGGLARLTGIESWAWRLGVTLLVCLGGIGLPLYVLLWLFVPDE
jgi:phage shock protein PspC (stress-responsive transcriptional regulator)